VQSMGGSHGERSTGPRAGEGKARAGRNAYSGATRPLLRELARALRQQTAGNHYRTASSAQPWRELFERHPPAD